MVGGSYCACNCCVLGIDLRLNVADKPTNELKLLTGMLFIVLLTVSCDALKAPVVIPAVLMLPATDTSPEHEMLLRRDCWTFREFFVLSVLSVKMGIGSKRLPDRPKKIKNV